MGYSDVLCHQLVDLFGMDSGESLDGPQHIVEFGFDCEFMLSMLGFANFLHIPRWLTILECVEKGLLQLVHE